MKIRSDTIFIRLFFLLALHASAVGVGAALAYRESAVTAVHFLDVGQGDAMLLRSGGAEVLVDGGPDTSVLRELGAVRPSWDRRIDVLILTHPQRDHLGGLLPVIERQDIGLVLLPKIASTSEQFRSLVDLLLERNIPVRFAGLGQQLRAGNIRITVVAPDEDDLQRARTNANNGSVVLRVDTYPPDSPHLSLLLTGDIERLAEYSLVRRAGHTLDVEVLKVPHHGSRTSTSRRLLLAVKPALALVSAGAGNRYGHPTASVLRRLQPARILRTDHHGTISLRARKGSWLLRCARTCGDKH